MVQGIAFLNAFVWLSAIESNTPLPAIIATISMVVGFVSEKKNSTISLPAKNRAKSKNI